MLGQAPVQGYTQGGYGSQNTSGTAYGSSQAASAYGVPQQASPYNSQQQQQTATAAGYTPAATASGYAAQQATPTYAAQAQPSTGQGYGAQQAAPSGPYGQSTNYPTAVPSQQPTSATQQAAYGQQAVTPSTYNQPQVLSPLHELSAVT